MQEISPGQEPSDEAELINVGDIKTSKEEEDQKDANGQLIAGQTLGFTAGFGFDPSTAGGFPGMGLGGDFNQLQMMTAMQTGMGVGAFGAFPMMGMSSLPQ